MNKTKARHKVKVAKATKPGKPDKAHKPKAAVKAVAGKAVRPVAVKSLPPRRAKPAKVAKVPASAAPEPDVVPKTIKWSAADLKQFRERLQRLHDVVVDDIGFLAGGHLANSENGVDGKSSSGSQDRTEDGTENFAQDLSLMQVSNKQDMLNDIIDAFRRLDQHTYGLCEQCVEPIAEARLRVQPFATKCIKCQAASEANRPRSQGFRKSMVQMVETEPS